MITELAAKNVQRLQRQINQFYLNDRGKHAETYAKTHAKDKVRGSNASTKQNRKEKGVERRELTPTPWSLTFGLASNPLAILSPRSTTDWKYEKS